MSYSSRSSSRSRWQSRLRFEPLEDRRLLSFALIGPNSGVFVAGDTVTIKWTANSVTSGSKISLCYDKDTTWNNGNETWIEIDGVTAANGFGSYSWDTTNIPVGKYYLAGYMWDGGGGFTFSHLMTPIVINSSAPAFALTSPMLETFPSGQTVSIEWTAANAGANSKISLCYDKDTTWNNGNETWIEIDGVPAVNGTGSYSWNTVGLAPGTYYVAGYMWDGGSTFNFSHMLQPITVTAALPFALSGPTSGTFEAGTAVNIQWTAANVVAGSKISLCYDEDASWSGGQQHWIEIDGVTAADGNGSYSWDTTGVAPGTYYIAGYRWDGGSTFIFSHLTQAITITAPPPATFVVNGPASGTFEAGTAVNIQWTAANVVASDKISLCYDDDAAWSGDKQHWIEIDGVTAADGSGSYSWDTTGVTPGTYYVAGYMWDGSSSFVFSHLTQSITITAAQGLTVESSAPKPQAAGALSAGELVPIVAAAESRLAATLGDRVSTVLAGVSFQIVDLPGGLLGETSGDTILIDRDAAGYGWFVDPTPADDSEFSALAASQTLTAPNGSPAANRADLLTTVMHEMGHELGLVHDDLGDLMSATLPLGVRRTFIDGSPLGDPQPS